MEEEAATHVFYLQMYAGLLLIEYVLTHFTHVWGYTFVVVLLMLRMHHGDLVPYGINVLLLWIGISYMRTSPTYDGECIVVMEYVYEPIAAGIHYLIAGCLVALKIPDSAYLQNKAQYAFLLLLLIPQHDSLFTCMPLWHFSYFGYYTIYLPPWLFVLRLFFFIILINSKEYRNAGICLTLQIYILLAYLIFLTVFYWASLYMLAITYWKEHEQPRTFLLTWYEKIRGSLLRDPREDDES